jgi:hypothetical protein
MPIHPVLFDHIPAAATQSVFTTLQQAYGDDAPPILDYQQSLRAAEFYDVSHLTGPGRAAFTSLLARDIHRHCGRGAASPAGAERHGGG